VQAGLGLVGMRERVAALQGSIDFEVGRPRGLTVRVSIPLAMAAQRTSNDGDARAAAA